MKLFKEQEEAIKHINSIVNREKIHSVCKIKQLDGEITTLDKTDVGEYIQERATEFDAILVDDLQDDKLCIAGMSKGRFTHIGAIVSILDSAKEKDVIFNEYLEAPLPDTIPFTMVTLPVKEGDSSYPVGRITYRLKGSPVVHSVDSLLSILHKLQETLETNVFIITCDNSIHAVGEDNEVEIVAVYNYVGEGSS